MKLKIKICMIVHAYYLKDARVCRYAETLAKDGCFVDVLCLREDKEAFYEEKNGVQIFRVNQKRRRGKIGRYIFEYFGSFIRFFFKINYLFFTGKRFEIIHVHNFPNLLVYAAAIQKLFGSKIILDVHDPMPELFRSKFKLSGNHFFVKFLYLEEILSTKFADVVITANHFFKEILEKRSCPSNKLNVIMNGPDGYFNSRASVSLNTYKQIKAYKILYIGTIAERYGILTALKAVANIKDDKKIPNIQFRVIPKIKNEGPYISKLLKEVDRLGLDDCFKLLSPVPHHKMPKIIQNTNLVVYTPMPDAHMDIALSLKIPEVVAMNCPLVTSRLSVLERYFRNNSLFMFKPGDIAECAQKIVEVYRNPEKVKLYTENAKKDLEKFSWEKEKGSYIKILNNLL